jgi:N-carbamoylputrescine amidase
MKSDQKKVKLGLVQMRCEEDRDANLRKALGLVENAAAQGAQIVCLQELFASLYFCQSEDH